MISVFHFLVVLGLLQLLLTPVGATEPGKYLVEDFEGEWISQGEAFGQQARSEMAWHYVLGDKFMQLKYRIQMNPEGNVSTFEGTAFYRLSEGDGPDAFWVDNSGDLHPIRKEVKGSAVTAHWGVDGGKQGRTRYMLLSREKMEVTDWILTPDGWRQFNQNTFTRLAADQITEQNPITE